MKYTLKAILVMALGCLTYSCLDLDPKDQIADGNYWQEASDFKLFANQFLWLDARFLEQRVRCASFGQAFGLDSG